MNYLGRAKIADEILVERFKQDQKWGEQNHPDGTGPDSLPLYNTNVFVDDSDAAITLAKKFTKTTDERFSGKGDRPGTWADILLEEIFEAMAEDDPEKLVNELIQSAAVIVAWVEAIRRRGE